MVAEEGARMNDKEEAISHIIHSTQYWSHDNMHYDYVVSQEDAFMAAVEHVRRYHCPELSEDDIKQARQKLGME